MGFMEIIAYARVSTKEQADDEGALIKQMRRLRTAGAQKIFYDVESRTVDGRKGLSELMDYINKSSVGSVSKFLFVRVDRLGSSSAVFYQLMDALRKKRIEPYALDENFDLSSIGGELTIDMRLAVSKYEVKMLALRVRKERETRKLNKKAHWRTPLGYEVENDQYVLDSSPCVCLIDGKQEFNRAQLMRFVFDKFFEVGSVRETAFELHRIFGITANFNPKIANNKNHLIEEETDINLGNVKAKKGGHFNSRYPYTTLKWSITGLRTILVNPVYAGGTPYNVRADGKKHRKHFDDNIDIAWATHGNSPADTEEDINEFGATGEAIITLEEHERIKEILRQNRSNRWATEQKYTNPYAYLVKCAYCGSAYTRQCKKLVKKKNFIRHHYQCSNYKTGRCANKTMISSDSLDEQVIVLLQKEAVRLSTLGQEIIISSAEAEELPKLRQSLSKLEEIPDSLAIASVQKAKEDLREQIALIQSSSASVSKGYAIGRDNIIRAFSDPEFWSEIDDPADKTELLKACISRILIDGNRVKEVILKI